MATKKFIATKDFRYGTRMLRAGSPVEMDAPKARLYSALGAISPAPVRARPATKVATAAPAAKKAPAKRKRAANKPTAKK